MTNLFTAAQRALDALEDSDGLPIEGVGILLDLSEEIAQLRTAIEQSATTDRLSVKLPPSGWRHKTGKHLIPSMAGCKDPSEWEPLYELIWVKE